MRGTGERLDRFVHLVRLLSLGDVVSISEAAKKTGADISTVRHQLDRLHDAGLIHIAGARRNARGPSYPVYAWANPFGAPDVAVGGE